jgi:hypothetical protein
MRKYGQIRRHTKIRTNYHDEDDNDTNLKPPTRVKHTNEQRDTETLTADVLQSANTKINRTVGGGRLDRMENGNTMTIYLNLYALKRAGHPG